MRPAPWDHIERFRFAGTPDERYGAFQVPHPPTATSLRIVVSSGDHTFAGEPPWEHVSVSTAKRCPNWPEMCFVKDLFWDPEETVMQLHPPKSQWVNNHPYCLHLWRPLAHTDRIPMPPSIMVGVQGVTPEQIQEAKKALGL